jgi:hypothetical protein
MRAPSLTLAAAVAAASLLAAGCGAKTVRVALPPRVDLQAYETVGIVDFASERGGKLDQAATQRFMALVQASQPRVRFLELGPADRALPRAAGGRVDPEAVKALGRRHGLATLFTGSYEISSPRPRVAVGADLASVSASARVRVSLTVRQWDAGSGATLWTDSRWGEWSVAEVGKAAGGPVTFGVSDPEDRYAEFLDQLVDAVTADFRVRYERREVGR